MTVYLASGFETGSLLEATATSGATISTANKLSGDRACSLASGGYVSYTTSIPLYPGVYFNASIMQQSGTGTISCIKIVTSLHYYEVKAVNGAAGYGLEFHRDGVKVTPSSVSNLPSTFLKSSQWENISLYMTLTTADILVNGRTIVKAPYSDGIYGITVTQVRVTAGTSTMYVDDITAYTSDIYSTVFDLNTFFPYLPPEDGPIIYSILSTTISGTEAYKYHMAVIPLRPATDINIQLTPVTAGQNADMVNDLETGDTAYVSSTGVSTTKRDIYLLDSVETYITQNLSEYIGYIGTRVDDTGERLESPFIIGVNIQFGSRQTVGNDVYAECKVDINGTYKTSGQKLLTTSYQIFSVTADVGPDDLYTDIKAEIHHVHGTTSREIRTSSVTVCALALIEQSPTTTTSDESYKISFDIEANALLSGSVIIGSNIKVAPIDQSLSNMDIQIYESSGKILVSAQANPSGWVLTYPTYYPSSEPTHVEIIYHDKFASIYLNSKWAHTFAFSSSSTPDAIQLTARSSATATITNVVVSEISDWREAIWIEYETSGDSAIQSVFQERPIIKVPSYDGNISYFLNHPNANSPISILNIGDHGYSKDYASYAGSDALVYYTDVKSVTDSNAIAEVGFHTSVHQLSSLDSGAIRASKLMLARSLETMTQHTVSARLDLRIEEGDIASVSYTATGIGESESATMYVISKSISVSEQGARMQLAGRQISSTPSSNAPSSIDDIVLEIQ